MRKKFYLLVSITLLFVSCSEYHGSDIDIADLSAPESFNYNMNKNVSLTFEVTNGAISKRSTTKQAIHIGEVVKFYIDFEDQKRVLIGTAMTNKDNNINLNVKIPEHINVIRANVADNKSEVEVKEDPSKDIYIDVVRDNNGSDVASYTYNNKKENSITKRRFGRWFRDQDRDGVIDRLDAYPKDSKRAFEYFFPGMGRKGTLAFEDKWPNKGDYDFNDLIVDYSIKWVYSSTGALVDIAPTYELRAVGGSMAKGFAIILKNVKSSDIDSVKGNSITNGLFDINVNGTEKSQPAIIPIFDDAHSLLGGESGTAINSDSNMPMFKSKKLEVKLTLKKPLIVPGLIVYYDHFIVVDKNRGHEIHRPGHKPTALADQSLFGTEDDVNNIYRTAENLPWALDIPVSWTYPKEGVSITDAYPKFGTWAQSGGSSYNPWFVRFATPENLYMK